MASYVIVLRRGLYCIEAIRVDGERRAVESHRGEKAAVQRLSELHARQQQRELRQVQREQSRWYAAEQLKV